MSVSHKEINAGGTGTAEAGKPLVHRVMCDQRSARVGRRGIGVLGLDTFRNMDRRHDGGEERLWKQLDESGNHILVKVTARAKVRSLRLSCASQTRLLVKSQQALGLCATEVRLIGGSYSPKLSKRHRVSTDESPREKQKKKPDVLGCRFVARMRRFQW